MSRARDNRRRKAKARRRLAHTRPVEGWKADPLIWWRKASDRRERRWVALQAELTARGLRPWDTTPELWQKIEDRGWDLTLRPGWARRRRRIVGLFRHRALRDKVLAAWAKPHPGVKEIQDRLLSPLLLPSSWEKALVPKPRHPHHFRREYMQNPAPPRPEPEPPEQRPIVGKRIAFYIIDDLLGDEECPN